MTDTNRRPNVREQRPLGYWLRAIDGSIEQRLGAVLTADGLNRRGWQVLNTVACGPLAVAEVDETMAAFLSTDEPTMRPYLDRLVELGWAGMADDGTVALTDEGSRAHHGISGRIGAERVRMMECLTPEELAVLMELLQRVAGHLDPLSDR